MKAASKEYRSGKVATSKRYRANADDTSLKDKFKTKISSIKPSQRLSVYAVVLDTTSVIPKNEDLHILSIIKNHDGHRGLWVHSVLTGQKLLCQDVDCVFDAFVNIISQLHNGIEGVSYVFTNDAKTY